MTTVQTWRHYSPDATRVYGDCLCGGGGGREVDACGYLPPRPGPPVGRGAEGGHCRRPPRARPTSSRPVGRADAVAAPLRGSSSVIKTKRNLNFFKNKTKFNIKVRKKVNEILIVKPKTLGHLHRTLHLFVQRKCPLKRKIIMKVSTPKTRCPLKRVSASHRFYCTYLY